MKTALPAQLASVFTYQMMNTVRAASDAAAQTDLDKVLRVRKTEKEQLSWEH